MTTHFATAIVAQINSYFTNDLIDSDPFGIVYAVPNPDVFLAAVTDATEEIEGNRTMRIAVAFEWRIRADLYCTDEGRAKAETMSENIQIAQNKLKADFVKYQGFSPAAEDFIILDVIPGNTERTTIDSDIAIQSDIVFIVQL